MSRIGKYSKYLLISLFQIVIVLNSFARNNTDSVKVNSTLSSIKSLIDSRQFAAAQQLSIDVITQSKEISYYSGESWGKYYLGIAYFELTSIDSALFWMREAATDFESLQDQDALIKVWCQLGNFFRQIVDNDSSTYYFRKAIQLAKIKGDSAGLAESNYGLGMTLSKMSNYPEAMELYISSMNIRQHLQDKQGVAAILNSIGILFWYQGDYGNALEFFLKALPIREEANDLQALSYLHNNIGLVLRDINEYPKAIEHLKKSWGIKIQINDVRGISNSLMNIGSIFLLQNKLDSALIYFDQATILKQQVRDRDGLANIFRYKGEVYRKLKLYDKSLTFLLQAQANYRDLKEPRGEVETMIQFAITNFEMGLHNKAIDYLKETEKISKGLKMIDLEDQVYFNLYSFYNHLGNCEKTLFYYQQYVTVHDSLVGQENLKKMLTLQLRSEYDALIKAHFSIKDNEFQLVEKEKESKTKLAYFFMIAFGITLAVLGLFFFTLKNKNKINNLLGFQQLEVERQKQELIQQRDELEIQKNLVIYQRDRIINMLTDLGESIDYARKIQQAILPTNSLLHQFFSDYFIIYQPKESVGGDFYWVGNCGRQIGFAVADCTGHGVPGGFMSMLGISMINDMITRESVHAPSILLSALRQNIINALGQHGREDDSYDGMDIALCTFDKSTRILTYSGANLPILISTSSKVEPSDRIVIHYDGLVELKPDRMPVSYFDRMESFHDVKITLEPSDTIYLFSDGFVDQFGGEMSKKFGHTAFRSLINSVKNLPLNQQKQVIWTSLEKWKGETENQTDDILVMGVRLS